MKFKKTLKYVVPTVGVAALATSLPLALTSCGSNQNDSIKIKGKTLKASDIQFAVPRNQTYWVSKNNPQYPILNANIYVGNDNSILSTDGVLVTYQWYKNALPIQTNDANSSQYVVTSVDKSSDQYFCVVRISYEGKQIVKTSPLYTVTPSPLSAKIDHLAPTRFPSAFAQVNGYNSQLKAVVNSTSSDFDLQQEIKNGNVKFEWMKKSLIGQDKIVGQNELFEPTSSGIYYCNITIIKDGQYVTVKTKDEVVTPNPIQSSISTGSETPTKIGVEPSTFYVDSGKQLTLTPKLDKYLGQTPASDAQAKDINGVYATMWLKKNAIGGYTSNNNWSIVDEMAAGGQAMSFGNVSNPTGEYMLVEAIYPQNVPFENYERISAIKYTDVIVKSSIDATNIVNDAIKNQANIARAKTRLASITQVKDLVDTTSLGYKTLVNGLLEDFGLSKVANLSFEVQNGNANEDSATRAVSSTANNGNSYVSVKLKFTPKNGYDFEPVTTNEFLTAVQQYTVLTGIEDKVKSLLDSTIKTAVEVNLDETNYNKGVWAKGLQNTSNGTQYKTILDAICGTSSNSSLPSTLNTQTYPNDSFEMSFKLINNGKPSSQGSSGTASSSTKDDSKNGKCQVEITFTANPGYVFDATGTTKFTKVVQTTKDGWVVNPVNAFVTNVVLPNAGIVDKLVGLVPQLKPVAPIIQKAMSNQYFLSTNLFGEIIKLIVGLGGKAEIVGNPVFEERNGLIGKGTYKVTFEYKTLDENKWMFPNSSKKLTSPTIKISVGTAIPNGTLKENAMNGWIAPITLTTKNESGNVSYENGKPVELGISTSVIAPSFLSSYLKLNYEWYQSSPATKEGEETWTYVSSGNGTPTLTVSNPTNGTKYKCKVWLTINGLPKPIWVGHALWSPIYTLQQSSSSSSGGEASTTPPTENQQK